MPGNDDASRAILLYCNAIADTIIEARQGRQANQGLDLGAMDEPPVETYAAPAPVEVSAPATMAEALGDEAEAVAELPDAVVTSAVAADAEASVPADA